MRRYVLLLPSSVIALMLTVTACGLSTVGELDGTPEAGQPPPGPDASHHDAGGMGMGLDSSRGVDTGAHPPHEAGVEAASDAKPTDARGDEPMPPPFYPSSCEDADAGSGTSTVTLYVGADPAKPWTAVCSGGKSYLTLAAGNVSSYPAGGCANVPSGAPQAVTTTWTRINIDPATLVVDTSDYTGATSVGKTHEVSGDGAFVHDYTAMPFASARSCDDAHPSTPSGNVDLTGTSFIVSAAQPWNLQGFSNAGGPFGGAVLNASDTTVALSVGGYPAGLSPCNDYYTTNGGSCLQLVYSP